MTKCKKNHLWIWLSTPLKNMSSLQVRWYTVGQKSECLPQIEIYHALDHALTASSHACSSFPQRPDMEVNNFVRWNTCYSKK